MSFYDYLKNIFLVLILLQIAPSLLHGIKKQYFQYLEPKTQVGVISFKELISDASCYIKQLDTFFKDGNIKAILFKMDCPGSTSGSGQMIYDEIMALKKEYPKPVITLVENVCASGAFWIACASDYIIAPGSALIGSIGAAFMYNFKLNDFLEQYNIHYKQLKAGEFKGATNPFADSTPQEYAMLQGVLDDTYQQFVHAVATSRKLSVNNAKEWANGKIFTAHQALKLDLVDELGSMSSAIRALKEKALIEGGIEWVKPTSTEGWFAKFLGIAQPCTSLLPSLITSTCKNFGILLPPHVG